MTLSETDPPPDARDPIPQPQDPSALPPIAPNDNDDPTPLRTLCATLHAQIEAFLQEDVETETLKNVQKQCRHSLGIIAEAIERYPLNHLSLSYNGGKDCLLLLILYLSLLSTHPSLPPTLNAIYIPPPDPFPTVDAFVLASSHKYHLHLSRFTASNMKSAFQKYLASSQGSTIEAIFVGTRRTDPHGERLKGFEETDHGWPLFVRVHPVLEWGYGEVWVFLRRLGVGFCELYGRGYTSLGGVRDTRENPLLAVRGEEGGEVVGWLPAWELREEGEERAGRGWKVG